MTSCEAKTNETLEAAFGAVLSGDYTADEFRAANRHLASCESCRAEFGALSAFRPRWRGAYGLEASPAVSSWHQGRTRMWGGLALAASLVVGLAIWQAAPGVNVMTVEPRPLVTTVEIAGVNPEASLPSNSGNGAVEPARASVDELDVNLDEITDEELDEILYELGA